MAGRKSSQLSQHLALGFGWLYELASGADEVIIGPSRPRQTGQTGAGRGVAMVVIRRRKKAFSKGCFSDG